MAGSQTLRFDIVGDASSASRAFKQSADDAVLAAKGAKQLSDSLTIQSKSAQVSAAATVSLAKSDDILRDAQLALAGSADDASGSLGTLKLRLDELNGKVAAARVSLDGDKEAQAQLDAIDARLVDLDHKTSTPDLDVQGVAKATAELSAVDVALDKVGGSGGSAEGATSWLDKLSSVAMPALIGAGVALSPVIATTSIGLAGFGAAAAATIAPILAAGTATKAQQEALAGLDPAQRAAYTSLGALKTQFSGFAKTLEPETLGVFNKGLQLADGLLGDVEPVAAATGKGLSTVVTAIGADLKTQQWQQFFGWMAQTAGPDIQLLGTLFTNWLNVLPPLLEELQPLATTLLNVGADAGIATSDLLLLNPALNDASVKSAAVQTSSGNMFTRFLASSKVVLSDVTGIGKATGDAATGTKALGANAAAAAPQVGTLSGDVAILNSNTAVAADATKAFDDAWAQFVGKSVSDQQAVLNTAGAFDAYNTSLKTNKADSTASQQAFLSIITTMGSGLSTLQTNGATVGQLNSFYQANIDKLNTLHGLTPTERKDVQDVTKDYLAWANTTSGLTRQVQTASDTIKNQFLAQIGSIAAHAPGVSGDVSTLANSILKTGNNSSATRADRTQLIDDLEKAGLTAQQATGLVNKLQGQINAMHGKSVSVGAVAHGSGAITATENILGEQTKKLGSLTFVARGAMITGGVPGKDSVLLAAMPGELMVPKYMVDAGEVDHLRGRIPGFAAGGVVGQAIPNWMGTEGSAFVKGAANAGTGPLLSAFLSAAAVAAAAAIAAGTPVAYSQAAGVTQWEPDVSKVLSWLGLPQADLPTVMSQIQTESGGNPNAINLTDINAQRGDPSKGLMQVISETFAAYRSPSLSANIYDPDANIFAGVNYAVHRYGNPGWLSVLGHGHGYDNGGYLPTGLSLAYNGTGVPEPVIPARQFIPGGGSGGQVHVHLHNEGVIGSQAELKRWLLESNRELARIKGGGNVQTAFGRS